jgi:predicted phage terminase large subunit-like protein
MIDLELNAQTRKLVQQEKAKRSLSAFVRYMWPEVEPGVPLRWHKGLDAICLHLEAATRREIQNVIINIPPRNLKSTITSVLWPSWVWLNAPHEKLLTGSYNKELAIRDAVRSRRLMLTAKYQEMVNGAWRFEGDGNVKSRYENNQGGWRISTSVDSGATGEGGSIITVDDPHPVQDAVSDADRQRAVDWWNLTMWSRINDHSTGVKLVIGQRIGVSDLTGQLLEAQGGKGATVGDPKSWYTHLCLPIMWEKSHPYVGRPTPIGWLDWRAEEGELLAPDQFDVDAVEAAKRTMGAYDFAGQYQQRPSPAGGNIFRNEWFRYWNSHPPKFDRWVMSWDLSFKGAGNTQGSSYKAEAAAVKNRSFVVGQCWGFIGAESYLLDEVRGQWNIVETIAAIHRLRTRWPACTRVLVEDKANGPAVYDLLKDSVPGIRTWEPEGSKIQRAHAVQAYAEAGQIVLPSPMHSPWINDWVDEVTGFPFSPKNDRVDAMTQALLWAHRNTIKKSPVERMAKLSTW